MTTELAARVAEEIRAEIGRRNMSKRDIARQVGASTSTMNRWLNGETPMDIGWVDQIAAIVGLTTEELLQRGRVRPGGVRPPTEPYLRVRSRPATVPSLRPLALAA